MARHLTIEERGDAIGQWKSGVSRRQIAANLGVSPRTRINDLINFYEVVGKKMGPGAASGIILAYDSSDLR